MIYDVRQTSLYTYECEVPHSRHMLRLKPVSRPGQRVVACSLEIDPAPGEQVDAIDFFGNATTQLRIGTPHTKLRLTTRARVAIEPPHLPDLETTPAFERIRADAAMIRSLAPDAPAHFLFQSRLVPLDQAISAYAAASFPAGRPIGAAVMELTRRIRADIRYDTEATDVATSASEAFAGKGGVCQDFAQIMLAGLRGLGLPAAYVSGFLRTRPPEGKPRLEGADETHAWVAVWCGAAAGWIGFDPTNGVLARDDHVVLAIGRDYADVAPVIGVLRGSGDHKVDVSVDVVPVI